MYPSPSPSPPSSPGPVAQDFPLPPHSPSRRSSILSPPLRLIPPGLLSSLQANFADPSVGEPTWCREWEGLYSLIGENEWNRHLDQDEGDRLLIDNPRTSPSERKRLQAKVHAAREGYLSEIVRS